MSGFRILAVATDGQQGCQDQDEQRQLFFRMVVRVVCVMDLCQGNRRMCERDGAMLHLRLMLKQMYSTGIAAKGWDGTKTNRTSVSIWPNHLRNPAQIHRLVLILIPRQTTLPSSEPPPSPAANGYPAVSNQIAVFH